MTDMALTIRKQFEEGDKIRDEGLATPAGILRFDSIAYDIKDPVYNLLDVYRPKTGKGKLPVILSIHGGAWVYGDKDVYQWYCMSLAERGFAVVNYSYRLAPEYKYPSSFEDTVKVCEWMAANAQEYGLDMDNVFGVGDSAGAHMLSLFAAALTNPDYAKICGYELPKNFAFKAIALNCGAFKIAKSKTPDLTTMLMGAYLPDGGTEKEFDMISAAGHITENYPPVYLMTCPGDFLKDQPANVIPVLEEKNVQFVYHRFGDKTNELGHVFHCNIRLPEATVCNDEECAFFKEFIVRK